MATDRPDPGEFLELAQRMLRDLFGDQRSADDPWAAATSRSRDRAATPSGGREPSPGQQRENLTFALATRAVEALEDVALNVAAIRQRLERTGPPAAGPRAAEPRAAESRPAERPDVEDATGQ